MQMFWTFFVRHPV